MTPSRPALLLLLLLLAAACTAAPQPAAHTALVVAIPAGAPARALAAAAKVYAQAGGEAVEVAALPADGYLDQVSAALLAGLDRYDLVWLPVDSLAKWAGYKMLRPLDALLPPADREALAPWLAPVSVEGALYGLPAQPDPLLLWYRADWLAAAGLDQAPTTWRAFQDAAQRLNDPPRRYGAALAGGDLDAGLEYAAVLAGWKLRPVGPDPGALAVGDPGSQDASREALALYAGWFGALRVTPPGAEQATRADVVRELAGARAAMGLAPLSAAGELLDCAASPKACSGGKPQVRAAWPPGATRCRLLSELSAWAVPLHAARPEPAQRFAGWLATGEGARAWAQGGGLPARRDASAALPAAEKASLAAASLDLAGQPCYELALPPAVTAEQLWQALGSAAHAAASGQSSPNQAVDAAAEQMLAALRQAGYR